jgi:hypothetical protein
MRVDRAKLTIDDPCLDVPCKEAAAHYLPFVRAG